MYQEKSSLYAIARNSGIKIPGPKGSMAEVKLTAILPAEEGYGPIIRRGTKFSAGSQQFELLDDVGKRILIKIKKTYIVQ